jgi:hypothetical protein
VNRAGRRSDYIAAITAMTLEVRQCLAGGFAPLAVVAQLWEQDVSRWSKKIATLFATLCLFSRKSRQRYQKVSFSQ